MTRQGDQNSAIVMAPEVLFIIAMMAVFACYAVWRGTHAPGEAELGTAKLIIPDEPAGLGLDPDNPVRSELQEYYVWLAERAPVYGVRSINCPLDNTPLELPYIQRRADGSLMDNSQGGIATDFMKIAVGPPTGMSPQPDLLVQQWEQLPVSCPSCLNTYQETDLNNLRHPQRLQALREHWNLIDISPGLAAIPLDEWTPDAVQFCHYLSSREAQTEHLELAWIALSGAYASNFVVWSGESGYHIPSAAFYALAAAEFRTAIELGWEGLPEKSRSETILALLECQRLLGREPEARATLAQAREVLQLEPALLPVLEMEERFLDESRYSLERVNLDNKPAPPIGWQLDKLLPAMNGHIAQFREDWQTLRNPAEAVAAINSLLAAPAEDQ